MNRSNYIPRISTRSRIEEMYHVIQLKNQFFEDLEKKMNAYTIENNVFGWKDDECSEINEGYYLEVKKLDHLNDAYKEFDLNESLIRIQGEDVYLGKWLPDTKQISEGLIIDLNKKIVL